MDLRTYTLVTGLLNKVIHNTGQFFTFMEEFGQCKLDLMLVREVLSKTEMKVSTARPHLLIRSVAAI